MKHVLSRVGGGATLLAALAGFAGCTEEDTGLFIVGNLFREAPDCSVTADASSARLSVGILDVALAREYGASLLVGNQLTPRGDKASLRTETTVVTITGAEVLLLNDTGETDAEFTVPASGVISPDGSDDPGFGLVLATLIPATSGQALAEQVGPGQERTRVAQVKVFGETIGGVEVESSEFTYVIRVCNGCLIDFPAEARDVNGLCTVPTDQEIEVPCVRGNDVSIDCRALL